LTQANFRVLLAENGQRALEILYHGAQQAILPDIILLDVAMTGLDGFETCRQIKAIPIAAHIPILFITAHDQPNDKVRGFDVGGADYITKPLDLNEVHARINTHLALTHLRQELKSRNAMLEQELQNHVVQLQVELENRRRANEQLSLVKEERNKLLDLARMQSDQMSDLANSLLKTQTEKCQSVVRVLQEQIEQKLANALTYLETAQAALAVNEAEAQNNGATPKRQLQMSKKMLQEVIEHVAQMTRSFGQEQKRNAAPNPLLALSARERETLALIADGKSNSEIAGMLYVAEATVRTHRARIMHKLNAKTTYDLARIVLEHNER
jgi:DNA-binding NarL/FixJ family response regulator